MSVLRLGRPPLLFVLFSVELGAGDLSLVPLRSGTAKAVESFRGFMGLVSMPNSVLHSCLSPPPHPLLPIHHHVWCVPDLSALLPSVPP